MQMTGHANTLLFGPASVDPEQRTALPREKAQIQPAAAVQPCSSPLSKGTCSSLFSPERHKRSVPSSGRRREEKGSVVFLSLFLSPSLLITKLLTRSESPDGNPPELGSPLLLQGACPWLIFLCPDGKKRKRERRKKEKPQTSFANRLGVGAWIARPRLGGSGNAEDAL